MHAHFPEEGGEGGDGLDAADFAGHGLGEAAGWGAVGGEEVVAEVGEGFVVVVDTAGGFAEEVAEHEEAVGGPGCGEGVLEPVVAGGGGFEVAQLRHVGARGIEHPDDVAEDGFLDDGDGEGFGERVIADEGCHEEVAQVGAGGFGGVAREEVEDFVVGFADHGRVVGREAEEEVVDGEVGFDCFFGRVGQGAGRVRAPGFLAEGDDDVVEEVREDAEVGGIGEVAGGSQCTQGMESLGFHGSKVSP